MEFKDWLMILATLLSPLIAVQVTIFIEKWRAAKNRKVEIFRAIMTTRGAAPTQGFVNALNLIDIEFSDWRSKDVRAKWKAYLANLRQSNTDTILLTRMDLLADLLHVMGKRLGYDFDKTDLKSTHYLPDVYTEIANEDALIRKTLMELLTAKDGIPVEIRKVPLGR